MPTEPLSNEEFFARLSALLAHQREKSHGSIFLTQKRMTDPTAKLETDGSLPDLHPSTTLPLLVRATNGKSKKSRVEKVKISTIVQPEALPVFFARYAEACKSGMQALKKRDRSARKKAKAKKKKGAGAAEPTVSG